MLPKYMVRQGDTLAKIAKQFGVDPDEVRFTNLLIKNWQRLQPGTTLYLPSTFAYVAKAGETLPSIARKFGFSVQQLHLFNEWLAPSGELGAGEHVYVPRSRFRVHRVIQGETLAGIARQSGILLGELVAMNAPLLPDPQKADPLSVRPGMQLAIPVA